LAFIGAGTGLFTAYNLTFDSDTEVAKVIEEQKSEEQAAGRSTKKRVNFTWPRFSQYSTNVTPEVFSKQYLNTEQNLCDNVHFLL
tara:strand:- start:617 stop:871 length:255 start_codon:yes stop_codon:yes gene_type:complete